MEDPEDELSILGNRTRSFCLNQPYILPYKIKCMTSERFLTFLNKLVYVNGKMDEKIITTLEEQKYEDSSGVTVFSESVDQTSHLSLLIFALHQMITIFVLDPTQLHPNFTLKTRSPPHK